MYIITPQRGGAIYKYIYIDIYLSLIPGLQENNPIRIGAGD